MRVLLLHKAAAIAALSFFQHEKPLLNKSRKETKVIQLYYPLLVEEGKRVVAGVTIERMQPLTAPELNREQLPEK